MNTEVSDGWRPGDLPLPLSPLSHSPSKTARPSAPSAPEGCWPGPQGSFWGQQSYITCVCLYGHAPQALSGHREAEWQRPAWRAWTPGRSLRCDLSPAGSDRVTLNTPLRLRSSLSSPPREPGQGWLGGRRRGAQKLRAVMLSRGHPSDSRRGELSDKMHSCDAERTVSICSPACACVSLCGLRAQPRTWEGAGHSLGWWASCPPPGGALASQPWWAGPRGAGH